MLNLFPGRRTQRRGFADDRLLKLLLVGRDGPAPTRHLAHRSQGKCSYRLRFPGGECPWCATLDAPMELLCRVASL